jgi:hypothetical protein
MRTRLAWLLALTLAAGARQGSPAGAPAEASAELVREEHFLLERRAEAGARPGEPPPWVAVGTAVLRKRVEGQAEQGEAELRFLEEDTRVHHVERWRADAPRLVWREWRPGAGRTLVVDSDVAASRLALVEWGRDAGLRASLDAPEGVLLPLYALELARRGELAEGSFPCFDPLARAVERRTVELEFSGAAGAETGELLLERRVRLLRDDGTCAGWYLFRGGELVELAWQHGDLRARRVERAEHDARLADQPPPGDAALVAR